MHTSGNRRTTLGVGFVLSPWRFQGLNSDHETWQQEPLPTEPSPQDNFPLKSIHVLIFIYIYVCLFVCVSVCSCVCRVNVGVDGSQQR